jgi:hypothetical protein
VPENQVFSRQNGVLILTNTGFLGINIHVGAYKRQELSGLAHQDNKYISILGGFFDEQD